MYIYREREKEREMKGDPLKIPVPKIRSRVSERERICTRRMTIKHIEVSPVDFREASQVSVRRLFP